MSKAHMVRSTLVLASAMVLAGAIGCGGSPKQVSEPSDSSTTAQSTPPPAEPTTPADDLATKERELAQREAEVKLQEREQEIARREAAVNAKPTAPKSSSKGTSSATHSTTTAAAGTSQSMSGSAVASAPAPVAPVIVPAGTQLSVEIMSPLSTKSAMVGDRIDARLAEALVVNGKEVAPLGATVQGAVTQVISGSKKIGGTPTLGVTFDGLAVSSGSMVSISGNLVQQGKSDTAKDSAKIAGGVVAGAIIGHQISDKKGKLIGGLLGGAAGTAAAAKTGGEVDVPAGTIVGFALDSAITVD